MEFKIGQLSALLGIPVETLRFYENKGLIKPSKSSENGYRTYSTDDYFRLLVIKSFRGFGFSLGEIPELMTETDCAVRANHMRQNAERIMEELDRLRLVMSTSLSYAAELEKLPDCFGRCRVETSPAMYRFNIFENFYHGKDKNADQIVPLWLSTAPIYHMSFELTPRAMASPENSCEYRWGLSVFAEHAQLVDAENTPGVAFLPAQRSVYTIFKTERDDAIELRELDYAFRYIHENGLEISGNATGMLLYQPFSAESFVRYHSVWIPVKDV